MARFLRSRKAAVSALLFVPALLGPSSVAAEERHVTPALAVALPNGTTTGFAPNVLAISQGGSLNLLGADTQAHNIACVKFSRKTKRPLCQSEYAAAGDVKPVAGVEKLRAGTYSLICQAHPQMKVDLTVVGP